jgi:hypothetical protein
MIKTKTKLREGFWKLTYEEDSQLPMPQAQEKPWPTSRDSDEDQGEIKSLREELEKSRKLNQELHRRLQKVEAPAQSYETRLRYQEKVWSNAWVQEFNRVCLSHNEMGRIFDRLCEVYPYPGGGKYRHSVMDSKLGGTVGEDGAIYANLVQGPKGGDGGSYRVLDEVTRLVNEVKELRSRQ